ncbi:dTTP/UTP pyrophosphatase-like [Aphomia sociella]
MVHYIFVTLDGPTTMAGRAACGPRAAVSHYGNMLLQPLTNLLEKKRIVFASGSKSRKKVLEEKGLGFVEFVESHCDESTNETDPERYVFEIARRKAEEVARQLKGSADVVIGADTVVTIDNQILTKPDGANDKERYESACRMLRRLSGRENVVVTGIVMLFRDQPEISFCEKTSVYFDILSDEQIHHYVNSGEPKDKVGSYAIQGLAGTFIKGISGDYFSVLGAPVHPICKRLYEWINQQP